MRKLLAFLTLVGAILYGGGVANAIPIPVGSTFNISGAALCDSVQCAFPGATTVGSVSGAFSGFTPGNVVVMGAPFVFAPFTPMTVYTSTEGPLTTSFDVLSNVSTSVLLVGPIQLTTVIDLGIAYLTGYDPTPGTYVFTANQFGAISGTFSASTAAIDPPPRGTEVPEPASMALLGAGLIGLGAARRKAA